MYLDVSQAFRAPGEEFSFLHEETLPPQEIFGDEITFDAPVRMEGKFSINADSLRLYGTLTTVAHGPCALCLEQVDLPIAVDFDEVFHRVDKLTDEMTEEYDCLAFEGSKVELNQTALTLALLELPIRFECVKCKASQDDQSTSACQKESPQEHPFAALQQLLTKDQEV